MKIIRQHIQGRLLEANGRQALLLLNPAPDAHTSDSLYLCFALVVQGPEEHILPAVVKDDWGNERRGLDVYAWLDEEGHRFPRTEIFGFDPDGSETQCFLRALELVARLPVYVYTGKQAPVADGRLLTAVLLPDESVAVPEKLKRPSDLALPLARAAVNWWLVHPATAAFDF